MFGTRTRIVAAVMGLALALAAATPVFAWTQLFNNYPGNPTSCDNSPGYPCLAWPKVGSKSSTVHVYLDPSLTQANLNLDTDVNNSIYQWHIICAANPILLVGSPVIAQYLISRGTTQDPTSWAETSVVALNSAPHVIVESDTTFNSLVTWDHSFNYDVYLADSRKVATHELGHGEGLGHTGYTAIMHQGAESFWVPQTNDIQGMQHVYGTC